MSKNCIDYFAPKIEVQRIMVEHGFAQTSNVEDPVIKPDQDW